MSYIRRQFVRVRLACPQNDVEMHVEMHGVCHQGLEDPLAGALSRLSEANRILLDRAPNPTNDVKLFLMMFSKRFDDSFETEYQN